MIDKRDNRIGLTRAQYLMTKKKQLRTKLRKAMEEQVRQEYRDSEQDEKSRLRVQFAGQAMQCLVMRMPEAGIRNLFSVDDFNDGNFNTLGKITMCAYLLADRMLERRDEMQTEE